MGMVTRWSSSSRSLARARNELRDLGLRVPPGARARVTLFSAIYLGLFTVVATAGGAMVCVLTYVGLSRLRPADFPLARIVTALAVLFVGALCVVASLRGARAALTRVYRSAAREVNERENVAISVRGPASGVIVPGPRGDVRDR